MMDVSNPGNSSDDIDIDCILYNKRKKYRYDEEEKEHQKEEDDSVFIPWCDIVDLRIIGSTYYNTHHTKERDEVGDDTVHLSKDPSLINTHSMENKQIDTAIPNSLDEWKRNLLSEYSL